MKILMYNYRSYVLLMYRSCKGEAHSHLTPSERQETNAYVGQAAVAAGPVFRGRLGDPIFRDLPPAVRRGEFAAGGLDRREVRGLGRAQGRGGREGAGATAGGSRGDPGRDRPEPRAERNAGGARCFPRHPQADRPRRGLDRGRGRHGGHAVPGFGYVLRARALERRAGGLLPVACPDRAPPPRIMGRSTSRWSGPVSSAIMFVQINH